MPVLIALLLTALPASYFIAAYGFVIDMLREAAGIEGMDTAMLRFSDHGESLGENNVYLYGLPYRFAPREQTEVLMMLWGPTVSASVIGIDRRCVGEQRVSNCRMTTYFTRCGILDVNTSVLNPHLDLFHSCVRGR
jgi:lipid A ethanolaminephosphotransferase